MKKSQLIFTIIYVTVALLLFFLFFSNKEIKYPVKNKNISLEVSYLTNQEKIYRDKNFTTPIDIKNTIEYGEMYNKESCYSLIFQNSIIHIEENSAVQVEINKFNLIKGKIFWLNMNKKGTPPCNIGSYEINIKDIAEITYREGNIKIRALRGDINIKGIEEVKELKENKELSRKSGSNIFSINTIMPAPKFIEPKEETINFNDNNGNFYFSWSPLKEAKKYDLNIYQNRHKDSLVYSKSFKGSRVKINLYNELKPGVYFAQVQAVSKENVYGKTSEMKKIDLRGVIIKKSVRQKSKPLTVSTSTNGFFATIKGTADVDGKLFINDEEWFINKDGTFSKTIEYPKFGRKVVEIKYITPDEEVIERKEEVIIFEE